LRGVQIKERFLWPKDYRSVLEMKLFAVDLLSDKFGAHFGAFDPREVECKFPQLLSIISPGLP